MSKYLELRTKLTEKQYLVEALRSLGYNTECASRAHLSSDIWATNGLNGRKS